MREHSNLADGGLQEKYPRFFPEVSQRGGLTALYDRFPEYRYITDTSYKVNCVHRESLAPCNLATTPCRSRISH